MSKVIAPVRDHDAEVDNGDIHSDVSMEKDDTEEELEKLVFGDNAGFLKGLNSHQAGYELQAASGRGGSAEGVEGDEDEGEGMEDYADDNVSFAS